MPINTAITICPLMSAGADVPVVCVQERCTWYVNNLKTCSVYVIAHNALLDVKSKQGEKK